MTDDATVLTFVARCRHRLRLLLFVRYLVITFSAVCLICIGLFIGSVERPFEWAAAGVAAAITASAAAAFRRTPSADRVAREIDQRLQLANAVGAALQLRSTHLAVAPLVLRGAAAHVRHIRPATLFQFELRRPGFVLAFSALLLILTVVFGRSGATGARSTGTPMTSSGKTASGARAGAAQPGSAATATSSEPTSANAEPVGAARSLSALQAATSAASATRTSTSDRQSGGAIETPAGSAVAMTSRPERSDRGDATFGASGLAQRRQDAGGQGLASSAGRGASSGGAGAAGLGEGTGAGGVQGQRANGAPGEGITAGRGRAVTSDRYADARQRASAALSRDLVPPDLRAYVRAYFIAIAPEGK